MADASQGTNGAASSAKTRGASKASVRQQIKQVDARLELQEKTFALAQLSEATKQLQALQEQNFIPEDPDRGNWVMMSSGGAMAENKMFMDSSLRLDPQFTRRSSYFMWRTNPIAHGILRTITKFIVGREFKLDFADTWRGKWSEDQSRLIRTGKNNDDPLLCRLLWDDFCKRNKFLIRSKEIVLRTLRDGEVFIRKFVRNGRVDLRFIEPARLSQTAMQSTTAGTQWEKDHPDAGRKTTIISQGIEFLAEDIETVVAYHVAAPMIPGIPSQGRPERVDAADVYHGKCYADMNDLRGVPFLEPVLKALKDYEQWAEYRLILNKARTAVALVRKVDGTFLQGQALVQGRALPRTSATGNVPMTASGAQEAAFKPGSILTPSAGVDYDFKSPNLQARDAAQDGRQIQMNIAAGVGLPDMMVTGDYSQSNYASAVEAKTPAVREVEDWQDFFAPLFESIYDWVIMAAIDGLNMPKDTDRKVELHWPPIIHKDAFKETQRYERLSMNGIVSKKTWAANEGLIYDDEQENIDQEPQDMFMGLPLGVGAGPNGGQPSPASTQNPKPKAKTASEALLDLATLEADLAEITDPAVKAQMLQFLTTARRFVSE